MMVAMTMVTMTMFRPKCEVSTTTNAEFLSRQVAVHYVVMNPLVALPLIVMMIDDDNNDDDDQSFNDIAEEVPVSDDSEDDRIEGHILEDIGRVLGSRK